MRPSPDRIAARRRIAARLVPVLVVMGLVGYTHAGPSPAMGKFRVPKYDEQGRLRTLVSGDTATITSEGAYDVANLRLELYDEDRLDVCVTAPRCVFDDKRGTAKSESSVRIERESMVVTGEDFEWDSGRQRVVIRKDVTVTLHGAGGLVDLGGNW